MPAIHQFTASFAHGDAISNQARAMRKVFRSWGCASDIFCEARQLRRGLRSEVIDIDEAASAIKPDDVVLLHLSVGSHVNDVFAKVACRKALLYHNMTPEDYFRLVNASTVARLKHGRQQLARLAGIAEVNLACSRYNAAELAPLGYRDVRILPLLFDEEALAVPPDQYTLNRFSDGRTNILFVGRCAPNKRIEDLITAFAHYQRFVNPTSRLIHVGAFAGAESYYYLLKAQAREAGVDSIFFAGPVPQAGLNAFYACAAAFVCMSEHEGFCLPLLECMAHGVPVLAYAAAAVPETLDGAGVLFRQKDYPLIAETLGRVTTDQKLRAAIVEGQRQRLARYRARDLASELRQHLAPLLAPAR